MDFEGKCYVLLQTDMIHPIAEHRHEFVWYPERAFRLFELVQYRPYVKSVVTENPWIISCYDRKNVFVWREGQWVHPDVQTYGASVNHIMMSILGIVNTIPYTIAGNHDQLKSVIDEANKGRE